MRVYICTCAYIYIYICGRKSETFPRCNPTRWGARLGRRRVSPTLPLTHTHTHTRDSLGSFPSAVTRHPGRGMRPKGSRLFFTAGARHPRAPAPGWAAGGFVASFFSFFFFFSRFWAGGRSPPPCAPGGGWPAGLALGPAPPGAPGDLAVQSRSRAGLYLPRVGSGPSSSRGGR